MKQCCLCLSGELKLHCKTSLRPYWQCNKCELIQVPADFHLAPDFEKRHYDTHENNPEDSRYRKFLERLCGPLGELLPRGASGLDFGCGPGPTLSILMEERGHHVRNYDPHYLPDPVALTQKYDFITMTEVIEHLRDPRYELARLWESIKDEGVLAIMTQMTDDIAEFGDWYYQRDPTHICFWSCPTFRWLAQHLQGAQLAFPGLGVVFLQKTGV